MGAPIVIDQALAANAGSDDIIIPMYATGTGSAKDVVCQDLTASVVTDYNYEAVKQLPHTEAANDEAHVVGVALEAWTEAGWIQVQVQGIVHGVACASGVAAGDKLIADFDTSNAGRCGAIHDEVPGSDTFTTAAAQLYTNAVQLGVALSAAASNTCSARLTNPQGLS